MKIRSIFGAACAAIAIATATPAAAHGVGETVTPHFEQAITQHSRQVAGRRGRRLCAGRSVAFAHPREIGLHLRLRPVGRNRVAGE